MGVSTDGILAYGISLGGVEEDAGLFWLQKDEDGDTVDDEGDEEEQSFEEWWEEVNGVSQKAIWAEYYAWEKDNKTGDYAKDQGLVERYEKLHPQWRKRLNNYYDDARRVRDDCPVELVTHCSYDYPMYILAVKGTEVTASRGYPEEISEDSLIISDDKMDDFREFCETYKIKGDPRWWLVSMWG